MRLHKSTTRAGATAGSVALLLILAGCASGASTTTQGSAVVSTVMTAGTQPADQVPIEDSGGNDPEGNEMTALTAVNCGDRFDQLTGQTGDLVVTGTFPSSADSAAGGLFTGTVTVTAGAARVAGVTTPEVDVYLTQFGVVVGTPMPKDMIGQSVDVGPGESAELSATVSLQSCTDGSAVLPAGQYEVFAVVVVNQDDGNTIVATGGPWPLAVQ